MSRAPEFGNRNVRGPLQETSYNFVWRRSNDALDLVNHLPNLGKSALGHVGLDLGRQ